MKGKERRDSAFTLNFFIRSLNRILFPYMKKFILFQKNGKPDFISDFAFYVVHILSYAGS